jgi:hypothetical protein
MFMKKTLLIVFSFIVAVVIYTSCKKKSTNPCDGVTITVQATKQDASAGQSNGSITVTSPTGAGVTYSLNGGTAGATASFTGLAAGTYTVTAKNANGCSGTASFTIAATDPCAGKTIVVTTPTIVGNIPCTVTNGGSVTASATGSTGFTYKIGAGTYQSSPTFTSLTNGVYVITARDVDGCERTASVTIADRAAGPLFTAVKGIMQASCVSCHNASGASGGVSLATDCNIVNTWDRIKVRCVDGTPSFMPQGGQLPAAQKTAITNWVNAGHRFID